MINRTVLLTSLSRKYSLAYDKAISALTTGEKIHITQTLMELSRLYKDIESNHEKIKAIHSDLLNKYRKKLKPVIDAELYVYFERESVLMHKGIDDKDKYFFTVEQYNKMTEDEQVLSDKEYDQFIDRINNHMARERQEFYLSMEPEKSKDDPETEKAGTPTPHTTTTPSTPAIPTEDEDFITSKEAAALLKVSKVTLHKWKLDGKINFYRIGTRVRFKKSEVVEAMKGGKRGGKK